MKLKGYKVIILSAMLIFSIIYAYQVNGVNPFGPMIILTFDDTKNIETCAKYVLPVLEEFDFKAIGYFTTGYNKFTRFKSYLMELIEAGWEIGSHAHTHPKFTEISYNEREYELRESKDILESILGAGNVLSFAYPGHNGIYDKDITEQVWKYYDYVRPASDVEMWKTEFGYYNPLGKIVSTSKNDNCVSRTRSAVSYAKANNCPVWLVFHRVEPTLTSAYSITTTNFRRCIQIVYESGLKVTTMKDLKQGVEPPQPSPTPPPPPTDTAFDDSFESGNFRNWSGTRTSSGESTRVDSILPLYGNYHATFMTTGGDRERAYCYKQLNSNEIHVEGWVYFADGLPLPDNKDKVFVMRLEDSKTLVGIGVNRKNERDRWYVHYRDGSSWMYDISSAQVLPNRWYHIELFWKMDSSNGVISFTVDSSELFSDTEINTSYYGDVEELRFGIVYTRNVQNPLIMYGDYVIASGQ